MSKAMEELGKRIAAARVHQRYPVNAAAKGAGISRDTWAKIEAGESVQDVKRAAALDFLGLDDHGEPAVGGDTQDRDYVGAPGDLVEQHTNDDIVLAELRAIRREVKELSAGQSDLREDLNAVSRRVARIESGPEPVGGADGQT